MSTFHYSNLRVKFEGEEGSGPGVNRGFFAAVANALKTDEKVKYEIVHTKCKYGGPLRGRSSGRNYMKAR